MLVLEALAVAMVLLATVTDLLEHKIYNVLTFPMMLVGILGHLVGGTWWEGVAAMFAVGAPFMLLYLTNILKAGDVKLLMAVGALLGLKAGGMAALCSVIMWCPIGIVVLLVNGRFANLRNLFRKDYTPWLAPFGLAIGLGTVWALSEMH